MRGRHSDRPSGPPGEIVYLLVEIQAGGRIHEIGARALVLDDAAGSLTLQLGDGDHHTVTCPSAHVLRRQRQRTAGRGHGTPRLAHA